MGQALLESVLLEWSSYMDNIPVFCTSRSMGVRLDKTIKLPQKDGDFIFHMGTQEISVPVRLSDLSPVAHIKDLEETLWQSGYGGSLTLEETHTWKDLMGVSVEDLMNIALEQGFRGYLGIKVLERRLSVC